MKYEQENLLEKFIQNEKKSKFWALLSAAAFTLVSVSVVYVAKEVKGSSKTVSIIHDTIHTNTIVTVDKMDSSLLSATISKFNKQILVLKDSFRTVQYKGEKAVADKINKIYKECDDKKGELNEEIEKLQNDSKECDENYKKANTDFVICQSKLNDCQKKPPVKQFNIFIKYYNKVSVTAVDKLQKLLGEKFPNAGVFRMRMEVVIGSKVWYYNKGDSKTAESILSVINDKSNFNIPFNYSSFLNETNSKPGNFEIWLTQF